MSPADEPASTDDIRPEPEAAAPAEIRMEPVTATPAGAPSSESYLLDPSPTTPRPEMSDAKPATGADGTVDTNGATPRGGAADHVTPGDTTPTVTPPAPTAEAPVPPHTDRADESLVDTALDARPGEEAVALALVPAPPDTLAEAAVDLLDAPTIPLPPPSFRPAAPGVIYLASADIPTQQTEPLRPDPALAWPVTCAQCGGVIDADGYCTQCGARAPHPRDHYTESPAAWVGGACDIGRHHRRNEDALALAATPRPGDRAVLVVCDGVTTSQDSDVASLAGARQACATLWLANAQGLGIAASRSSALAQALRRSIREADRAVIGATAPDSQNPASATIAVAWIEDGVLHTANLGDSRVYWLPDDGAPVLVSEDHSLAQAQIEEGVPRETAEASVLAHTITKWLGRDSGNPEPYLGQIALDASGWVLVCSDGLWNYASDPATLRIVLHHVLAGLDPAPAPVAVAEQLVAWANEQGGHDNITAAMARWSATSSPEAAADLEADQGSPEI